jgi:hypothetical protein
VAVKAETALIVGDDQQAVQLVLLLEPPNEAKI